MIADPFVKPPLKATTTCALPTVSELIVGAAGGPYAEKADEAEDSTDHPAVLYAAVVHVYEALVVSPVTDTGLADAVPVTVVPRPLEHVKRYDVIAVLPALNGAVNMPLALLPVPVTVITGAEGAPGTQFELQAIVVLGGAVVGVTVVAAWRVVGEAVAVSRSTATALFWSAEVVVVRDPTRRPVQLAAFIVLSRT